MARSKSCTWCGVRLAFWQRRQCGTCCWSTLLHVGGERKWTPYQSRIGGQPDRLRLGWPPIRRGSR